LTKANKKIVIIVICSVLGFCVVCVGGFFGYVGIYYHAESEVFDLVAPSNITVTTLENGDMIFAPNEKTDYGFVFYQGGKVEYSAYIPLMEQIAKEGIYCVLVKMPFNLAFFGQNKCETYLNDEKISHWYIGGHSLGGVVASQYLAKHTDSAEGLVLMASYSTSDLSDTDLKVMTIIGSNDKVLNREQFEENKDNLPKENLSPVTIKGGIHSGFGKYGAQKGDGEYEMMTNDDQIKMTAQFVSNFILGNE